MLACEVTREAISARLDGEEPPVPDEVTSRHLATCRPCRDFESRAAAMRHQMRLSVLPELRDLTQEVLALLDCEDPVTTAQLAPSALLGRRPRPSWLRVTQWAAGLMPLGVAVPALALGIFSHPHIVPSHVLTPCTMSLVHHLGEVKAP